MHTLKKYLKIQNAVKLEYIYVIIILPITLMLASMNLRANDVGDHLIRIRTILGGAIFPWQYTSENGYDPHVMTYNIAYSNPVAYFPYIISNYISTMIDSIINISFFSDHLQVIGSIFIVAIIFVAIKVAPMYKWLFFAVSVMPVFVYQSAVISADNVANAFGLLAISAFLKIFNERQIRLRYSLLLFMSLYFAVSSKQNFAVLLVLPVLLFFAKRFRNQKSVLRICAPLSLVFGLILWWLIIMPASPLYACNENGVRSLSQVIIHPILTIITVIKSSIAPIDAIAIAYGNAGVNEDIDRRMSLLNGSEWLHIGPLFIVLLVITLVVASNIDNEFILKHSAKIKIKMKYVWLLLAFVSLVLTDISMYIAWYTCLGGYVTGVQGRYFILCVLFSFMAFPNLGIKNKYTAKLIVLSFCLINVYELLLSETIINGFPISVVVIFIFVHIFMIAIAYSIHKYAENKKCLRRAHQALKNPRL